MPNPERTPCPLCDQLVTRTERPQNDSSEFDCDRCGRFQVSEEALHELKHRGNRYLLMAATRRHYVTNRRPLLLSTKDLDAIESTLPKTFNVEGRAHWLLLSLTRCTRPSTTIKLAPQLAYPLACAQDAAEFDFYLSHLCERRFITSHPVAEGRAVTITAAGWVEAQRLPRTESAKAFVAMWFNDDMRPVYDDVIRPAIEACGYQPVRIDDQQFLEGVVDQIIAEIKESRFLVADVTGQRNGVYFEGGYSMGLGIPVIWTVNDDDRKNLHFDTQHFNHIVWKGFDDLRQRLVNRIRATIGRGPLPADQTVNENPE